MASLFEPLWYCGARDVLGAPIATGTAYFYVVGSTSEFVDTFADAAETEPITSPVTLDAGGRAQVYLKDPAKVVIKDSTGAIKQTIAEGTATDAGLVNGSWDSVTTPLGNIMADLEGSLGPAGYYKESSETGVTDRSYHNVVRQFVSPYDFGASGGGTVDDTTKLQAAIDRAIATGLPLNLETGTYKITAGLSAAGIISIYGAGMGKAIITTTATGFTGLSIISSGNYLRDFAIHLPYAGTTYDKALSIAGASCTVERLDLTGGSGVYSSAAYTRVADCVVTFKCPNTAGAYGYGVQLTQDGVVENVDVNGVTGNSGSYLTCGVKAPLAVVLGGTIQNCYRAAESLLIGTTVSSTCNVGVLIDGYRYGAIGSRVSATTPFLVGYGKTPVNVGNYVPGTPTGLVNDASFQTSASDTPTFTINAYAKVHICKLTKGSAVSMCTFALDNVTAYGMGQRTTIILQTTTSTTVTAYTFDTNMTKIADPTLVSETVATSEWIMGLNKLVQVTAWTASTFTGVHF